MIFPTFLHTNIIPKTGTEIVFLIPWLSRLRNLEKRSANATQHRSSLIMQYLQYTVLLCFRTSWILSLRMQTTWSGVELNLRLEHWSQTKGLTRPTYRVAVMIEVNFLVCKVCISFWCL